MGGAAKCTSGGDGETIAEKVLFNFHKNNTAAAVYGALLCVYSQAGALELKQVPELQNQNIHKDIER